MANKGLALSKIPHGVLNNFTRDQIYESFDISTDNFMDVFLKVMRRSLGPNFSLINRTFNGVCVKVLSNKESQTLLASGHNFLSFQRTAKTTSKTNFKAIRVFIPEVHGDRVLPDNIINPSDRDKQLIEAMFPVFIARTKDQSQKKIAVGDIVEVQIKNNLGSGVYLHKVGKGNSTISIWNKKGGKGSADSFKCAILKHSKVVTDNQNRISAGTVITEGSEEDSTTDPATLQEQYIKYLYEKERSFIKELKVIWSTGAFKGALIDSRTRTGSTLDPNVIWALMYQTCGHLASGLSVGGSIMKSVQSITDSYGIFRYSKEYFDGAKIKFTQNQLTALGEGDHSDLLDPSFSMRFFLLDFGNFLTEKQAFNKFETGSTPFSSTNPESVPNKQIVTSYFQVGSQKADFLFPSGFDELMSDYDEVNASAAPQPANVGAFPIFNDWLIAKSAGIPTDPNTSTPPTNTPSENHQGPTETKQPATPDECHDNFPPYNNYLIHVDAQKKIVREFLNSPIAGNDLEFTQSEHIGVRSIKFADLELPTSFKVLRFDNSSPLFADSKRWFNLNNTKNLLRNDRYLRSYYRNKQQITHFTIGTFGNNIDESQYYKNGLHAMYSYNKPPPHFIISPNGQIIQLVDAAAGINNSLPTKRAGIVASFGEGPGDLFPIVDTTPTLAKPNYVLIKDNNLNNVYKYYKLGSKAALQAMQQLIVFFTENTNIKYNLAAIDGKLNADDINKSNIQATGHYNGIGGMNFIYYAWTLGLAFFNDGKNILLEEGSE